MEIILEPVKEDHCDLLYKWVNDETVRQNSFNTERISYDQHRKWFYKKINSSDSYLFICYSIEGDSVGQIRIDIKDNIGIIDYSVDKAYRGRGFGTKILKAIVEKINEDNLNIKKLIGKVKSENIASQKAFEKAGYRRTNKKGYIEYYKTIT